jgi:hypothetical protein
VSAHCAAERRPRDTIRQRSHFRNRRCLAKMPTTHRPRISRSIPRRKPPPHVPNRRPRFPTSTPPPGPSAHPSGFSVRSQRDSALAFGSAIPSAFRPRPSKQSFSAATHRFQPNGSSKAPVPTSVTTEFNPGEQLNYIKIIFLTSSRHCASIQIREPIPGVEMSSLTHNLQIVVFVI